MLSLCEYAKSLQLCPTLCDPMDWTVAHRLLCPWDSPGKTTGVGCHVLLQGIFPTQGLNPHLLCLLRYRQTLYCLSHQEISFKTYKTSIQGVLHRKYQIPRNYRYHPLTRTSLVLLAFPSSSCLSVPCPFHPTPAVTLGFEWGREG